MYGYVNAVFNAGKSSSSLFSRYIYSLLFIIIIIIIIISSSSSSSINSY